MRTSIIRNHFPPSSCTQEFEGKLQVQVFARSGASSECTSRCCIAAVIISDCRLGFEVYDLKTSVHHVPRRPSLPEEASLQTSVVSLPVILAELHQHDYFCRGSEAFEGPSIKRGLSKQTHELSAPLQQFSRQLLE